MAAPSLRAFTATVLRRSPCSALHSSSPGNRKAWCVEAMAHVEEKNVPFIFQTIQLVQLYVQLTKIKCWKCFEKFSSKMRLEEIGARIVETGRQQRSAEGHTDRIPNATVERGHLHPLRRFTKSGDRWMYPDPNGAPYRKSLYRPYIVVFMGYNPQESLNKKSAMNFPRCHTRCPESSCLLRLCFTHLPHCQALVHAPGKFPRSTRFLALWALGLGISEMPTWPSNHSNGQTIQKQWVGEQISLRPNHAFTDTNASTSSASLAGKAGSSCHHQLWAYQQVYRKTMEKLRGVKKHQKKGEVESHNFRH